MKEDKLFLYKTELSNDIQPREKIDMLGIDFLSDRELISVIVGSGTQAAPVEKISKDLLDLLDKQNSAVMLDDLLKISGLGKAKAKSILAILELGRRVFVPRKRKITSPTDILPLMAHYADRQQEHFLVYSLNGANEIISSHVVSIGLLNRTLVHPREVFRQALVDRAAAIIVAHNHPSGNINPSQEDIAVTKNLTEAGNILSIKVLDHIVFAIDDYYSFASNNKL